MLKQMYNFAFFFVFCFPKTEIYKKKNKNKIKKRGHGNGVLEVNQGKEMGMLVGLMKTRRIGYIW